MSPLHIQANDIQRTGLASLVHAPKLQMSQSTVWLVSYSLLNYASSYKLTFLCPAEMSAPRYHSSRYTFLPCLPPTEKWFISSSYVFPVRHGRAWYSMKQTFLSVFGMMHRN